MPTKKKKILKIFDETWYRTRIVAATTKTKGPLGYAAYEAELCVSNLNLLTQH